MRILPIALVACFLFSSCKLHGPYKQVYTSGAPQPIGPYIQATVAGGMLFTSGQIGIDPATGALAGNDIASQTYQAMNNLKAVITAGGSDMAHVAKVTVYLKDLGDYAKVNEIFSVYFPVAKPARSTVQVARLPKDALVEIDCVAVIRH